MKRYIFNTLMCGALALGSFSCTDKYIDINSDPYQPGDLNPDDYALGSAMSNLAGTVISDDNNTAQFTDCLLGGTCGGYFADSGAWPSSIGNFNATNDWTRVFLISDRIIPQLYPNLNTVKLVSQTTENPVPYAIAMVIKVAAMSRVTDAYGAIPYSQIGEEGKITVPYDSQEKVYDTFFNELDSAIVTLTENKDAALVPSADFVYSGNVQQWIKFANSLKLRLAMRISYANPTKAKEMAAEDVKERAIIETNRLNVREEPDPDSEVVGQVMKDERYLVKGEEGGWIQIEDGYISADYVTVRYALNEAHRQDMRTAVLNLYDQLSERTGGTQRDRRKDHRKTAWKCRLRYFRGDGGRLVSDPLRKDYRLRKGGIYPDGPGGEGQGDGGGEADGVRQHGRRQCADGAEYGFNDLDADFQ